MNKQKELALVSIEASAAPSSAATTLSSFSTRSTSTKTVGFLDHPYRDFETIPYMIKGQFQHGDSAGHKGTIGQVTCSG